MERNIIKIDEAELFIHMKNVIQNFDSEDTVSSATYGTNSFHTVWESMVNDVYGTVSKPEMEKFYYPKSKWVWSNGEKSKRNAPLRPDTIMIDDSTGVRRCFILDSKYYSYAAMKNDGADVSEDNSQVSVADHGSIPGTDSIQKQITYAEFLDNRRTPPKSERLAKYKYDPDKIFNAFILPGKVDNENGIGYIGYAEADWNTEASEGYRKIHGFLLDTKALMQKRASKDVRKKLAVLILREVASLSG